MAARSRQRGSKARRRSGNAKDAIALLKADHKEVTALFQTYEGLSDRAEAKKRQTAGAICKALTIHATIEEEIFYPSARAELDTSEGSDLLEEAEVEHASAKDLIRQIERGLQSALDDRFDAKVKVLGEYTKHHVKEEQNELFPMVRKSKLDLDEIGARLAERKSELSTSPLTRVATR